VLTYIAAYDGTDASQAAVRFAVRLARSEGAQVVAAHAYPEIVPLYLRRTLPAADVAMQEGAHHRSSGPQRARCRGREPPRAHVRLACPRAARAGRGRGRVTAQRRRDASRSSRPPRAGLGGREAPAWSAVPRRHGAGHRQVRASPRSASPTTAGLSPVKRSRRRSALREPSARGLSSSARSTSRSTQGPRSPRRGISSRPCAKRSSPTFAKRPTASRVSKWSRASSAARPTGRSPMPRGERSTSSSPARAATARSAVCCSAASRDTSSTTPCARRAARSRDRSRPRPGRRGRQRLMRPSRGRR
jgi:hypothetical protein